MTTLAANPPVTDDARRTIDVSIVIVNWNTRALLQACIESVRHHTRVFP